MFDIHLAFWKHLQVKSVVKFRFQQSWNPYHHSAKTPPNQGAAAALRHKNRELYVCVAAADDELLIAFPSSLFHHGGFITLVNGSVLPTWVLVQSNSTVNTLIDPNQRPVLNATL